MTDKNNDDSSLIVDTKVGAGDGLIVKDESNQKSVQEKDVSPDVKNDIYKDVIKAKNEELEKRIKDLSVRLEQIEQKKETNKQEKDAIKAKNEELDNRIEDLSVRLTALKDKIDGASSVIDVLTKRPVISVVLFLSGVIFAIWLLSSYSATIESNYQKTTQYCKDRIDDVKQELRRAIR